MSWRIGHRILVVSLAFLATGCHQTTKEPQRGDCPYHFGAAVITVQASHSAPNTVGNEYELAVEVTPHPIGGPVAVELFGQSPIQDHCQGARFLAAIESQNELDTSGQPQEFLCESTAAGGALVLTWDSQSHTPTDENYLEGQVFFGTFSTADGSEISTVVLSSLVKQFHPDWTCR